MRRILPIVMLASALLLVGAGCGKSSASSSATQNGVAPSTNGTRDRVYPGMVPYKPPTTPPPSSNSPNGPN